MMSRALVIFQINFFFLLYRCCNESSHCKLAWKLVQQEAQPRVLFIQGDIFGSVAGRLELSNHETKFRTSNEGVHVGEGGRGHGGRVTLIVASEQARFPRDCAVVINYFYVGVRSDVTQYLKK